MRKYCRGCNRNFDVSQELEESYIEIAKGGQFVHPKVDCDEARDYSDVPVQPKNETV